MVGGFLVDGFEFDSDAGSEKLINILDCLQCCSSIGLACRHGDNLNVAFVPLESGVPGGRMVGVVASKLFLDEAMM